MTSQLPVPVEVLKDLLPLYVAGEASAATRRLVEERIASDPAFARLAEEAGAADARLAAAALAVPLPPSPEKSAFDATRRHLRARSYLLGGAIFTSLLPFASHGNSDGIQFLLLRDAPVAAAISAAAAVALWISWWRTSRRLRVTGL